jgi:hypothetical protein
MPSGPPGSKFFGDKKETAAAPVAQTIRGWLLVWSPKSVPQSGIGSLLQKRHKYIGDPDAPNLGALASPAQAPIGRHHNSGQIPDSPAASLKVMAGRPLFSLGVIDATAPSTSAASFPR